MMVCEISEIDGVIQTLLRPFMNTNFAYSTAYQHKALENAVNLCISLKSLADWDFNFDKLYSALFGMPQVHCELLWNLHVFQIMPLETLLRKMGEDFSFLEKFTKELCQFCFEDCCDSCPILSAKTGLVSYIVEKAFSSTHESSVGMVELKQISEKIMDYLIQYLFSLQTNEVSAGRTKAFLSLWICGTLDRDCLNSFCGYTLHKFLNSTKTTEKDAFIVQDNSKNGDDPFHFVFIIKMLLKTLKREEIRHILNQAIWNDNTDWKNFCVVVASLSKASEDKVTLISDTVGPLLKDGFDRLEQKSLLRALLIGRQWNLGNDVSFATSYGLWFQTNVACNLQERNPQAVTTLIQVLLDMIPYESNLECIKILLERPLRVPPVCQALNSDYIVLLKTRVKDLQPKVDTEKIIEKVLCTFQETNKIPPYIMEASLMHKHHFLNEFLPALLKPRVIPSVQDTREKFINLLNRSGKIPSCIYLRYKISCQEEQQNLIAGINDQKFELMDDEVEIIDWK